MKGSLTASAILHGGVLAWAMLSLGSPKAFDVPDVVAMPVELVPISELSQAARGEETAPKIDAPAPAPRPRPTPEPENAQTVGIKELDQEAPETETQKAVEVKEAALPEPVEAPRPAPRPEPRPETAEPKPVPATDLSPEPAPQQQVTPDPVEDLIEQSQEVTAAVPAPRPADKPVEVAEVKPAAKPEAKPETEQATEMPAEVQPETETTPDPVSGAIAAAETAQPEQPAEPQSVKLPETGPAPARRPSPPAQTARTDERRDEGEPQQAAAAPRQTQETDSKADEVAELLNREKASGGGAKASERKASLGTDTRATGQTLSQSELDALRSQIAGCWNPPAAVQDAAELRVSVQFRLDPSGQLEGRPEIINSAGNRQADESARRAVLRCAPYTLPAEKYDVWQVVIVNFDPSDMLR